ncbi:MAG: GAF domain-containing protein [Chloroflexi bacterium]|nr:GAF domain-containing protein [Chloroflexota bacterium]
MSQQKQDIIHLRQRLAQSNVLVDATRRFASTLDSSEIKLALFEAIFQIAGAQQIALHLVRGKGLQSHICHPVEGFRMETAVLPPEATAFRIYEEAELVLWKRDDDNHGDPPVSIKAIGQFDSYLALPLKSADKVVGVVETFNLLEPKNAAQLADLLVEIAGAASLAIYNGILYQEAQYEIAERKRIEEKIAIDLRNQTVVTEILQIAPANDINELLQQVLDKILGLPWLSIQPEGGIFLKESDASALKLVAHRNLDPQLQTLCARVPFGRCLCGRAAATREIQFADCVDDNHEISFEGMAPHGHYNLPLIADDNQLVGVMVFYLEHGHQRDENEVAFLESVGHALANIVQRKQMDAALQEHEEELQILLELSPNAISVVNARTGLFERTNAGAEKLYGLTAEELLKVGPADMSPELQPDGRPSNEKIMEKIKEALDGDQPFFEWMHANVGGEEIPCEISLVGLPGTRSHLVRFSAGDITDRKQADAIIAKRAAELQTVAEVSMVVAAAQGRSQLLQEVVDLTKSKFGFYHTHVYLLNEGRDTLLLIAGAGKIGQQMVAEGRAISLDQEQSLVAQAARTAQGVTENDVRANPAFLSHPLLPETRSEMAVPMIAGERVIGVLDVQADENNYFTEQDVAIQTTLAAQIAIALENARSLEQAQEAAENLNELTRHLTREGWQKYLDDLSVEEAGFIYDASQLDPALPVTEATGEATAALSVNGSDTEAAQSLAYKIKIHGETIGQLAVISDEVDEETDLEMTEIIAAVTEQLSARIENLRLTNQTQMALTEAERQGEELALINQIVIKVAGSLDLQESMEIVAAELARALFVEQCAITLLNEARTEATVVAEYFGESEYERAIGVVFALEGNELMQQVVETQQPVMVTDAQHNPLTAPIHDVMRARGTQTLVILPMVAGNEVIGTVSIDILDDQRILHEEEMRLAETLVFQAATAVQNAQLFEQTETALNETEKLYQASAELNAADTYKEILDVMRRHTFLGEATLNVNLSYFDRPWTDTETPHWVDVLAHSGALTEATNDRYSLEQFPSAETFLRANEPVAIESIRIDPRVDDAARALYMQQFKAESTVFVPLLTGNQQIGYINASCQQPINFPEAARRRVMALARQAAVAVQSIRWLENARQRAQREQLLREISEKVRSSSDVETIMRTAVLEAGRVLGRRAFIYLENQSSAQE